MPFDNAVVPIIVNQSGYYDVQKILFHGKQKRGTRCAGFVKSKYG